MANQRLLDIAQHIMDSYYQDFRKDSDFFDLPDFAEWIGKVYGMVADTVAKEKYNLSLNETGTGQIVFSQDWWVSKEYPVKRTGTNAYVDLDIKFVGFTYDTVNSGIQLITASNGCGDLIRTTLMELWQLNSVTTSSITWWWIDDNKLVFRTSQNFKSVKIFYIPKVEDENFKLPSSKEFEIATSAWNFMMQAKQGTPIVDKTNDFNRNVTPQTEINQSNLKSVP